jgi:uncharacterized protein
MIILLTGGSGNVGSKIKQILVQKGFIVKNLSRNPSQKEDYKWDINQSYIDPKAFDNVDVVIHLAGAGVIDKAWSDEYKKIIYRSRIESTQLLYTEIKKLTKKPSKIVSTSAIGCYQEPVLNANEDSPTGTDFMAQVCIDWEIEALKFKKLGMEVSIIRTGIVLQKEGGFFPVANKTAFLNIFPTVGSPQNYLSWIHITDLCNLYTYMIENKTPEVVNGVAPISATQIEFMKQLAAVQNKTGFYPNIPSTLIKTAMGQRSSVALSNKQVVPKATLAMGFKYEYGKLNEALIDLV